ncbi:unnamed protein product [Calypogeia fissa]
MGTQRTGSRRAGTTEKGAGPPVSQVKSHPQPSNMHQAERVQIIEAIQTPKSVVFNGTAKAEPREKKEQHSSKIPWKQQTGERQEAEHSGRLIAEHSGRGGD